MDNLINILKTPTPSGCEINLYGILNEMLSTTPFQSRIDSIGNIQFIYNPEADFKIVFEAHIDEIGFMVNLIDDGGLIYLRPIGAIDCSILNGVRVRVFHNNISYLGLLYSRLSSKQMPSNYDGVELVVDIGLRGKQVKELISIGDFAVFDHTVDILNDAYVMSPGIDNRGCVSALVSALQSLNTEDLKNVGILLCLSAREEIGIAATVPYIEAFNPQVIISFDSCFVSDAICQRVHNVGNVVLDGGPIVCFDPTCSNIFNRSIVEIAKGAKIEIQQYVNIYPGRGLNSTRMSTVTHRSKVTSILLPTRYMHSPYEICSIRDYNALKSLVVCIINHYKSLPMQ